METLLQLEKPVQHDVYILSTSVTSNYDVDRIAWYLDTNNSIVRWSIDLLDWEKVMKLVVTRNFELDELFRFMHSKGYQIAEMYD